MLPKRLYQVKLSLNLLFFWNSCFPNLLTNIMYNQKYLLFAKTWVSIPALTLTSYDAFNKSLCTLGLRFLTCELKVRQADL